MPEPGTNAAQTPNTSGQRDGHFPQCPERAIRMTVARIEAAETSDADLQPVDVVLQNTDIWVTVHETPRGFLAK